MSRWIFGFLILVAIGAFFIPHRTKDATPKQTVSPKYEMKAKKSLLRGDVDKTDDLCRTQCTTDFMLALKDLEHANTAQDKRKQLQLMQKEHPHMRQLNWTPHNGEAPLTVGTLDPAIQSLTKDKLQKAKQEALRGKTYHSPQIRSGNQVYFVLGMPAPDGKGALTGVIHQAILEQVALHQKKNLRIVPYPSDKRYKIKTVDSDTLRKKNVNHPEQNEGTSHYHVNQVVVKFRIVPTPAQFKQIKADLRATSIRKLGYTYVFESTSETAEQMMDYFKKWDIVYAEPHFLYMTNETDSSADHADITVPNDALYKKYQWNLPVVRTEEGWNVSRGNQDVIVAVVDTGADLDHPDLKGNLVAGQNMLDPKKPPIDRVGHGSHVAGVIAALTNNTEGVAGMTWYNKVMPVKALDDSGAGSTYSVAQGIIWATDHGAKVINMSLGNYADAEFLHDAVRYAFDRDVVLIAASGNDNTDKPGYPAAYPEVFAVSATGSDLSRAPFSNYGNYIDVVAPGVNIASTYMDHQYAALSGTSMASPHVSALAALIRSANPQLKNTEVMQIMRDTAKDLGDKGKDNYFGYGEIDVEKSLNKAAVQQNSLFLWPESMKREIEKIKQRYKRIAE